MQCTMVDCPKSYMPKYGVDFDRNATVLGPFGSGNPDFFAIHKGKCSSDSGFFTPD